MLLKVQAEWQKITTAFPECKEDILAAADCYALEHPTQGCLVLSEG